MDRGDIHPGISCEDTTTRCAPAHQPRELVLESGGLVSDPVEEIKKDIPEAMRSGQLLSGDKLIMDIGCSVEHPMTVPHI